MRQTYFSKKRTSNTSNTNVDKISDLAEIYVNNKQSMNGVPNTESKT